MAKKIDALSNELITFIQNQKIFFVGTAATTGTVNVSPKGMDSLRVLSPTRLIWMNLTGSGNETAAHLLESNRMTIMFCAFEGKPLILRLYGSAKTYHERDTEFAMYKNHFPNLAGARQIFEMEIEFLQTSCGYAVPMMDFKEERTILNDWAEKQTEQQMRDFRVKYNLESIDGFDTKLYEL